MALDELRLHIQVLKKLEAKKNERFDEFAERRFREAGRHDVAERKQSKKIQDIDQRLE